MRPNEDGFTLIEVLVSLAIFSLAIVGLNRAASAAAAGTANLSTTVHAGLVADNAMARARVAVIQTGTPRQEARSGGMNFELSTQTSETELAGFYEILITARTDTSERIVATRRGFKTVAVVSGPTIVGEGGRNDEEEGADE